jgi:hypothetical protein
LHPEFVWRERTIARSQSQPWWCGEPDRRYCPQSRNEKAQAGEGDRQIIRAAIEDNSFNYGKTGWNFRSIYDMELKPWVQSTLAPALKAADPWTPSSSAILAIGGGSQLSTISQLLTHRGITPVAAGGWANARGLKTIA